VPGSARVGRPGYDLRLERSDGTVRRRLYRIGDGDPCHEVVWSGDGATLAVLSSHVARVVFVDVKWLLDHPSVETAHWSHRTVSFAGEGEVLLARNLRFVAPSEIEFQLCPCSLDERRRTGEWRCVGTPEQRRFKLPSPLVTGQP
jgi:hypothetical protein